MNPNVQAQIFDVARKQFVQVDGGTLAQTAILFEILVELRVATGLLQALASGLTPNDDLDLLRSDMVLDQTFVQFK